MLSRAERELLQKFGALERDSQDTLLAFLDFLHARRRRDTGQTPLAIERPASETVVAAIRRLRRTYPMLDADTLLHGASALVSAHVLQSRPAPAVIDELEALFKAQFARWRSDNRGGGEPD